MKRDQALVQHFLSAYNEHTGGSYAVARWPEELNRNRPAVEAVAVDTHGHSLAIEHTLIQPFTGERDDSNRFLKVFGALEHCPDLLKAGRNVDLIVRVGAIPNGVNWDGVADRIRNHLATYIPTMQDGRTVQQVEGLAFTLQVDVRVWPHDRHAPDRLFISRFLPSPSLTDVVRYALSRKVAKLVSEHADKRILLLEQADIAHGQAEIRAAIDEVETDFSELRQIDEVWLVVTHAWEAEKALFFYELRPVLAGRKFRLDL